jgi:GNAT superfamily N-acetyltransferase
VQTDWTSPGTTAPIELTARPKITIYKSARHVPWFLLRYARRHLTHPKGYMRWEVRQLRARGTPHPVAFARDKTRVIGWMLLDTGSLIQMFVDPAYRRQGVATQLWVALARYQGVHPGQLVGHLYMVGPQQVRTKAIYLRRNQ